MESYVRASGTACPTRHTQAPTGGSKPCYQHSGCQQSALQALGLNPKPVQLDCCGVCAGLDVVAGSTARYWGVGSRPNKSQLQRFEAACQQLASALQNCGGPYLAGSHPSLVSNHPGPQGMFRTALSSDVRVVCHVGVSDLEPAAGCHMPALG